MQEHGPSPPPFPSLLFPMCTSPALPYIYGISPASPSAAVKTKPYLTKTWVPLSLPFLARFPLLHQRGTQGAQAPALLLLYFH